MYRFTRNLHKWAGLVACLFLMVISFSGFFLAIKGKVDWMRPKTQTGSDSGALIGVNSVMESAFGAGVGELKDEGDVDRLEFHAEDRVWKVLSKDGYREVQVDGVTGKVLSVGVRNDQMFEDIHDLSFFAKFWHEWGLPLVAALLFCLSVSGVVLFFVPVIRRWKFKRSGRGTSG
jgi:uncharacterized iron-regulated membrane protein